MVRPEAETRVHVSWVAEYGSCWRSRCLLRNLPLQSCRNKARHLRTTYHLRRSPVSGMTDLPLPSLSPTTIAMRFFRTPLHQHEAAWDFHTRQGDSWLPKNQHTSDIVVLYSTSVKPTLLNMATTTSSTPMAA